MSLNRWNAKRDGNEVAIVKALQAVGAHVLRLDAFDLLVWYRGQLLMMDCKTPQGRPTKTQEALTANGWPLRYVVTPGDALRALGLPVYIGEEWR